MYPREFLRPLQQGWLAKIELARKARKDWEETAVDCTLFFRNAVGFMWSPQYRQRFWDHMEAPRFKMAIGKPFQFVAEMGPRLSFNCPTRTVLPYPQPPLDWNLLADPNDPNAAQAVQMLQQQDAMLQGKRKIGA